MNLRLHVLHALLGRPLGATATVVTFALLSEYAEISHQAVCLTLGELVSEGLVACDRTTAGVLYSITDSGRAQMLAASAGEMGAR